MTDTTEMTIAQNIREAAIYFPKVFLGDVECSVLDTFCTPYEYPYWQQMLYRYNNSVQPLMYMLIVAEALE